MSGRRGFLAQAARSVAVGAGLPVASGVANTASPDADLLALCGEFHAKHAACMAFGETVERDAEFDRLDAMMVARWGISDRIRTMAPHTAEGARAMAAVALVLLVENHGDEPADSDARFAIAALRGAAVMAAR